MHGLSLGAHFSNGDYSWGRPGNSHHTHHSHHTERTGHHERRAANQSPDAASVSGSAVQGSVKQAVVNQIRMTLTQHFELHQSSVVVAGATADEQAGNDLAGAVSSALNSLSGTSPTEAVAAVNDATTAAIQQTSQALTPSNSGVAPTGLDTAISQIQDQLQSLFSAYLANADAAQGGSSVTASGAKLITNAKGILEIHTQEGDTVTLSFASKSEVSVQNLQAGNGTSQFSSSDIQAFSKSRVSMSVQGDLNADELQAVQDLLGQVNQLADGFFSGDMNAVLSQAGGLKLDSSQLTDYSLHLALKQTFEAYGLNLSLPSAVAAAPDSTSASNGEATAGVDAPPADPAAAPTETATGASPAGDTSAATVDPLTTADGASNPDKTAVASPA